MITTKQTLDAIDTIQQYWTVDAEKVLNAIWNVAKQPMPFAVFLTEHTNACGGNWGGMLLTGVRRLYPSVYEAIPDDMGVFAWACICSVLTLLGIDSNYEAKETET